MLRLVALPERERPACHCKARAGRGSNFQKNHTLCVLRASACRSEVYPVKCEAYLTGANLSAGTMAEIYPPLEDPAIGAPLAQLNVQPI